MFQYNINEFNKMIANKLFCTFSAKPDLDATIENITSHYSILFNKIFVLSSDNMSDLMCTYNVDLNNTNSKLLNNTILLHRKKGSNTLYTINSLNELVKKLNNGSIDFNFPIEWDNYKNTLLLIQENELKIYPTKIYKIINL